ncbi:DEAD/DEAH box helicase family protein [Streptomyces rimosus]|uniref:DEAD/DEAH box helicase family protein n=1 Tax=Streptomyces rimosus TaxID=1927 RepID=UPI000A6680EC|nr:DEAD/DEAH box helicase family protein [Streptomyces rimosus]
MSEMPEMFAPRPYQSDAIKALISGWQGSGNRLAVVLPTGAGKTVVFANLISELLPQLDGKRALVIAHREELLDQAAAKVRAVRPDLRVGVVKAERDEHQDVDVVVASIQTLAVERRREAIRDIGVVIVDECHHAAAPSYMTVLEHFGAWRGLPVAGFTATMTRADGGLAEVWQEVVFTLDILEMIEDGYLCDVRGKRVIVEGLDLDAVRTRAGDLQDGQLGQALEDSDAGPVVARAYQEHAAGRPGVVFTPTVATAQSMAEAFTAAGIPAAAVWGDMGRDERAAALDRYRSGDVQVLANCMVLCLDTETEVLTDKGWTSHREMTTAHRVANWDQGSVFFKEPYEVVVRDRGEDEDMYVLETPRRSIRVTGRHRMLYRTSRSGPYKKAPVDDLVGRLVGLPTTGMAEPEQPVDLTTDECALIGFWLGDGSINRPGGGVEYTMSQSVTYPRIVQWVDDLLQRVGIDHRRYDKSHYGIPHIRWSLPRGTGSKSQRRIGVKRFEAYLDKSGSDLLWNLSKPQFDALLTGLWHADGNHGQAENGLPQGFAIYGCTSPLLEKLQAIAAVRGWACSYRPHYTPRDGHRQLYRLWFHARTEHRMGGTDPRYRIQKETAPWQPEKVWCVRTETRNIITRRRGSVTVMGNTEGFDAPWTSCAVIARPTKSAGLYCQMAGRALRLSEGKTDALILDVMGASTRHKLASIVDLTGRAVTVSDEKQTLREAARASEEETRCRLDVSRVQVEEFDLFHTSTARWLRTDSGVWFIPAGDAVFVFLVRNPVDRTYWMRRFDPERGVVGPKQDEPLPLPDAKAWLERQARAMGSRWLASRSAPWRARPASVKQLGFCRMKGIAVPPGSTAGEVSDLQAVHQFSTILNRLGVSAAA